MSSVRRVWLAAVVLPVVAAACSEAGDPSTSSGRAAIVYGAAVRAIVDEQHGSSSTTGETTDPDDRPVVYVVAVEGERIDPDVQAKVAHDLRDDIDVRFADDREEAIDDEKPDEPVRSKGVLLVVGPVSDESGRFDLEVERYTSSADRNAVTMSFHADGETWTVTSTSLSTLD